MCSRCVSSTTGQMCKSGYSRIGRGKACDASNEEVAVAEWQYNDGTTFFFFIVPYSLSVDSSTLMYYLGMHLITFLVSSIYISQFVRSSQASLAVN